MTEPRQNHRYPTLRFGSLFSGIGGLDLGLERAGMSCAWQVEINDFARGILAKHWPAVPRFTDVREVGARDLAPVELVAGGFPCKQTSNAAAVHGRRKGLDGHESGLWFEQLRIIGELRPRWALVENVSGVETWSDEITAGLEGLGYTVSKLPLSAFDVGAPHLRRRVFFAANAHGARLEAPGPTGPSSPDLDARRASARDAWIAAIPRVRGMGDGLSRGVDRPERILALGNAVVPYQAEWIGHLVIEADRRMVA